MLFKGLLPLSKVPPEREMMPVLVEKFLAMSLLPVEAERVALLVRAPLRMRVPPVGSMEPLLVMGEPREPLPKMLPKLLLAPPMREEVAAAELDGAGGGEGAGDVESAAECGEGAVVGEGCGDEASRRGCRWARW